jgi:hypothetical protein
MRALDDALRGDLALLVAGCSSTDVKSVNAALAEHYLEPLQSAGIALTIEDTCHLEPQAASEAWHLEIRVQPTQIWLAWPTPSRLRTSCSCATVSP